VAPRFCHKYIRRTFPWRHRRKQQPIDWLCGQVLEAVNRQVDFACQQRPLNLLRENPARADLFKGSRSLDVAACRNFHELNRMAQPAQPLGHPIGLPASELAASCAKTKLSRVN
jgi:hypothetical protein